MELNAWSDDLGVEVGGHGVVSHAGSAVLRLLADNSGLTGTLSKALARRGFIPVHDRGRVLVDTAVCIADGGRVLSDPVVLRDQAELFGSVASDPTLWPVDEARNSRCLVRHDGRVQLRPDLSLDETFLAEFARSNGIRRLALFGSALRHDFGPDSDVDLLVEFQPGHTPGLLHLAQMELELEDALSRPVELRTSEDLSPHFRHEVTSTARPLYAA